MVVNRFLNVAADNHAHVLHNQNKKYQKHKLTLLHGCFNKRAAQEKHASN